jgi:DNA-directed RNA polymerase subunit N|tara:strand:- start:924 stop:1151 length:228 start_codon:yes stop_codon:yes gene_type:complete
MIQPIRCFTCGKVTANLVDFYNIEKEKQLNEKKKDEKDFKHFEKNHTGVILDKLGLTRYCCRRMLISDVDMMNII